MSVAIIATTTPNSRKKLLIQELNLNFLVREFGTVTTTAVVGMPRGDSKAWTHNRDFIGNRVLLLWSPKLFPEVSHLQK